MADSPNPGTPTTQVVTAAAPQVGDNPQPQAGNPASSDPGSGQAPKTYDEAYVQSLRQEAASHRTKNTELSAKLKEIEDANLSATDKARRDADEAQAQAQQLQTKLQRKAIEAGVALEAATLKLADPKAAVRLMDVSRVQFDAEGEPTNLAAVLTDTIRLFPILVSNGQVSNVTTNQNNPARPGMTLTMDQIKQMTPAEINARWSEVEPVLAASK